MRKTAVCYRYEMKKLLLTRKGWLVLLVAVLLQIGLAVLAKPAEPFSYDAKLYQQYTAVFGGPYSPKTKQKIHAMQTALDLIVQQTPDSKQASAEQIEEQQNRILLANIKSITLNEIADKYERLGSCDDMQPELIYDLELTDYLRKFGSNWISLLCTVILIPLLMLGDANCGMEQILFPTRMGRQHIITAKLLTACTVSIGITAVCSLLQWLLFSAHWDFGALDVPVQSVTGFETCTVRGSVTGCIILSECIRLIAAPAAAMLVCLLSAWIRREVAVITASVLIFAGGAVLCSKISTLSVLVLYSPLSGMRALEKASVFDLVFTVFFILVKTGLYFCFAQSVAAAKK